MNIDTYKAYISAETMMGPNSARILAELFDKYPLRLAADDVILDLGCGTGLTSLIIARETGAKVFANDLWVSAEENGKRFDGWGVGEQVTPVCEDANDLHFEKKQFCVLVSIDSYHYFAGNEGFFQEKILPFMKDGGEVLIGIPGLKDAYADRAEELLSDWLGDDAYMFKNPNAGKNLSAATESKWWKHGRWIVSVRHGRSGLRQIMNMRAGTGSIMKRSLSLILVLWGFTSN